MPTGVRGLPRGRRQGGGRAQPEGEAGYGSALQVRLAAWVGSLSA